VLGTLVPIEAPSAFKAIIPLWSERKIKEREWGEKVGEEKENKNEEWTTFNWGWLTLLEVYHYQCGW